MNKIEAIEFINNQVNGTKTELIKEIDKDLYEEFCLLGYIKQGLNGHHQATWKITEQGKSQHDFYREPTQMEKVYGRHLASLGF